MTELQADTLRGAAGGALATVPMTGVMGLFHYALPEEREPVPPEQVTENTARKLDIADDLPGGWRTPVSLAAHFGYGAAAGGIFGPLARRSRLPAIAIGMVYGLGVWAFSYLGYLPALGLRREPKHDPPARTLMMVAAHLVWGASLGLAFRALGGRSS
ncbi:MAG: hypothetical protein ACM3S1_02695 [Hyphomicrobiales bacterium]